MSRFQGYADAGLHILLQKPAKMVKDGCKKDPFAMGSIFLFTLIAALAAPSGSTIPMPQRKPEKAALIQNSERYAALHQEGEGRARSIFGGTQIDLYQDIFRLQAMGELAEADRLINKLQDKSLMGHVLAQRYLSTKYKASFDDLQYWLARYGDHPQAARITRLANARVPKGYRGRIVSASYVSRTIEEKAEHGANVKTYKPRLERTAAQDDAAKHMIDQVKTQIQRYEPSAALRAFNENPASMTLDTVEKDRVRAMAASGYLYAGKTASAESLSRTAMASGEYAPLAAWVNGIANWRLGRYSQSIKPFELAASSPYASGPMVAAASYWAARAHDHAGHDRRAMKWLARAGAYPKTFYGLLALEALGQSPDLDWGAPDLARADERAILKTPAGLRAEKLLAAGEVSLAEAELKSLYIRGDSDRKKALLAYTYDRGLPALSLQLAHSVSDDHDSALYPSMPWSPNYGFRIDRALLHAIARQESRFSAGAENKSSGATGLMQIMPATAKHLTGDAMYMDAKGRALLKSPERSLDLGQQYVEELLNSELVGQDLFSLAIAYNAGPGTLARWKSERADITDPLLFIETLPFAETRNYVQRVLANYWIYRMKFDQPNDSMEAVAKGNWARYAAHDKGAVKFADAR